MSNHTSLVEKSQAVTREAEETMTSSRGTALSQIRMAEEVNQGVRVLLREVSAYLDWASCARVSLLTRALAEKMLREVKLAAEAAVEAQDGDYAVVAMGRKRGRS